jgi:hypothetical protein
LVVVCLDVVIACLGLKELPSVSHVVREKLLQYDTRLLSDINRSILYAQPSCMHGFFVAQ